MPKTSHPLRRQAVSKLDESSPYAKPIRTPFLSIVDVYDWSSGDSSDDDESADSSFSQTPPVKQDKHGVAVDNCNKWLLPTKPAKRDQLTGAYRRPSGRAPKGQEWDMGVGAWKLSGSVKDNDERVVVGTPAIATRLLPLQPSRRVTPIVNADIDKTATINATTTVEWKSMKQLVDIAKRHGGMAIQYRVMYHSSSKAIRDYNSGKSSSANDMIRSKDLVVQSRFACVTGTSGGNTHSFLRWKLPGSLSQNKKHSTIYDDTRPALSGMTETSQPLIVLCDELCPADRHMVQLFLTEAEAGTTPEVFFNPSVETTKEEDVKAEIKADNAFDDGLKEEDDGEYGDDIEVVPSKHRKDSTSQVSIGSDTGPYKLLRRSLCPEDDTDDDESVLSRLVTDSTWKGSTGSDKGPSKLRRRSERSEMMEHSIVVAQVAMELETYARKSNRTGYVRTRSGRFSRGIVTPSPTARDLLTYDDEFDDYDEEVQFGVKEKTVSCGSSITSATAMSTDRDDNLSSDDDDGNAFDSFFEVKLIAEYTGRLDEDSLLGSPPVQDSATVQGIVGKIIANSITCVNQGSTSATVTSFCISNGLLLSKNKIHHLISSCDSLKKDFEQYRAALSPQAFSSKLDDGDSIMYAARSHKILYDTDANDADIVRDFRTFAVNQFQQLLRRKSMFTANEFAALKYASNVWWKSCH